MFFISTIQYRIRKVITQIPALYKHQLGVLPIFANPNGMRSHPANKRIMAYPALHRYFSLIDLATFFSRNILERRTPAIVMEANEPDPIGHRSFGIPRRKSTYPALKATFNKTNRTNETVSHLNFSFVIKYMRTTDK